MSPSALIRRYKQAGYQVLQLTLLLNSFALFSCCEAVLFGRDLGSFLETQNITLPALKARFIFLRVSLLGLLLVELSLLTCHYFSLEYFFSIRSGGAVPGNRSLFAD